MNFIINKDNKELYVNQTNYTLDIIRKYNKQDLLPVLTPIKLDI